MSKTRLEKWNEPRKAAAFVSRPDDFEITAFVERRLKEQGTKEVKNELSEPRIIALAKELIFDIEQERPMFHVIMPLFNIETFEIEIGRSLQVELKFEEETPGEIKEDVKRTLALADSLDVPVYPNREEIAPRLAQYHRDLLIDGFKTKDESGKDVTLVLTNSPGASVGTLTHLKGMGTTQFHSPAEVHLVKETALAEIETREEAGHILAYLKLAIEELSSLLGDTSSVGILVRMLRAIVVARALNEAAIAELEAQG